MAANEGFDGDPLTGVSFSELLDSGDAVGLDMTGGYTYPSYFSTGDSPKMLCFGESRMIPQKSGITGSDSSSASSTKNSSSLSFFKSNKSRSGETKTEQNRKTCRKSNTENPSSTSTVKVRKEKLGERIIALQQLVSPFGKTDTASVLHEAMGYIRFLHDQVQVLSTPYLQQLPSFAHDGGEREEDESRYDLRKRGLCLIPVACTVHVANSNGADFWSPSMENDSSNH
ncbi:hypothetical protein HHK36_030982 [Tetracentron sinense]|uniref:BHLH domain-containing protein n=1 Tax=Tetracentron sinense TaxID=13715 RepID=A0A834YC18_TETSI|nr:hypothetical protein HHK36_030982 [Tetracentron sinense]